MAGLATSTLLIAMVLFFQNCSPGFEVLNLQHLASSSSPTDLVILPDIPIDPNAPLSVYLRNSEAITGDTITFKIELNKVSVTDVVANLETVSASAVGNQDFETFQGTVTVPAGQTSTTLEISSYAPAETPIQKTFALRAVSATSGALIAQNLGVGTLLENSSPFIATDIASSYSHSCAITPLKTVYCWGSNTSGQLGNGLTEDAAIPVQALGISGAKGISTGWNHTCAILDDESVRCWGNNAMGELGDGTTTSSLSPVAVRGLTGVKSIASGGKSTCAVRADNSVSCWGWNVFGQLGNGTVVNSSVPVPVMNLGAVRSIAVDTYQACAVTTNSITKCWGLQGRGLATSPSTAVTNLIATENPSFQNAVQVVAGGSNNYGAYQCILTNRGTVQCNESASAFRNLSAADYTDVAGLTGVTAISTTGYLSICATNGAGELYCWGYNEFGQNGSGRLGVRLTPVKIENVSGVKKIASGWAHACVIVEGGRVKCWGNNGFAGFGMLGSRAKLRSTFVRTNRPVKQLALGLSHQCALTVDEKVECWGNLSRDITTGFSQFYPSPIEIADLVGIKKIAAGNGHTCALTANGTAKCWGENFEGQLGNLTTVMSPLAPVDVIGLNQVTDIAASDAVTCAVHGGGLVSCWGRTPFTPRNSLAIVQIPGLSNITNIAFHLDANSHFTLCAVLTTGTAKCIGNNSRNLLGNPAIPTENPDRSVHSETTPVDVVVGSIPISGVTSVSMNRNQACAVHTDGGVTCWGVALFDTLLADLAPSLIASPKRIRGVSGVRDVTVARDGISFTSTAGQVFWAGRAPSLQFGVSQPTMIAKIPTLIPNLFGVAKVSAQPEANYVLQTDGKIRRLGDDNRYRPNSPGAYYQYFTLAPDTEIVFPKY